jgi:DNA repair exonuclease SbcCD nuclease subunit
MKFIGLNDVHLAHKGPVTRTDDWPETVFGKLGQVSALAKKVKAAGVLIAGDVFHLKSRVTHGLVWRLLDWAQDLRNHDIEVCAVAGNHDLLYDRIDSLPEQALGVLFKSGLFTNVAESTLVITRDGQEVRVAGVPYPLASNPASYDHLRWSLDRKPSILLAHTFANETGRPSFGEAAISYQWLLEHLGFTAYHFGHDHTNYGIVEYPRDGHPTYFIQIGSLTRGSLSKENTERRPAIYLLDVGGEMTSAMQVQINIRPASEVFDLALKQRKEEEHDAITKFVGDISAGLHAGGPVDFRQHVANMNVSEAVRERVLAYIAAAEGQA